MKPGIVKKVITISLLFLFFFIPSYSLEDIKVVPLINLEDISATFEEEKDELEKNKEERIISTTKSTDKKILKKNESGKIYVNLKALDKITAKTSSIKIAVGEKKFFGKLEIKPLKCVLAETEDIVDTVAYLQVKDLSMKNNDQVFVFNGWTFSSSPALRPIDHPVYDLWLIDCDNV